MVTWGPPDIELSLDTLSSIAALQSFNERLDRLDSNACPLHDYAGVLLDSDSRIYGCPHHNCPLKWRHNVAGLFDLLPEFDYLFNRDEWYLLGKPCRISHRMMQFNNIHLNIPQDENSTKHAESLLFQAPAYLQNYAHDSFKDILITPSKSTISTSDMEFSSRIYLIKESLHQELNQSTKQSIFEEVNNRIAGYLLSCHPSSVWKFKGRFDFSSMIQ